MKAKFKSSLDKIQRGLIAVCLIAAVVTVPAISLYQMAKPAVAKFGPNTAHPLQQVAAFQARPVDKSSQLPKLFSQPLISVTFDDGWQTSYSVALPLLQKYGIRTTQYILSGVENDPGYMSWDQIRQLRAAGHEIGCHSVTHPDLTTLKAADLNYQLVTCQHDVSSQIGAPVTDFASPYGAENKQTLNAISQYYQSQRNVWGEIDDGIDGYDINISSMFNRNDIVGFSVEKTTTLDDIKHLVAYTQAHNGWLVLTYHQIMSNPDEYSQTKAELEQQLAYLTSINTRIVTVNQVVQTLGAK